MKSQYNFFPIGPQVKKKTLLDDAKTFFLFLHFHNGSDEEKAYGEKIRNKKEQKYRFLNIGPQSDLNKIISVFKQKEIPKADLFYIKMMGHHHAIDFETLKNIAPKERKVATRSMENIIEILLNMITIVNPIETKINLHCCESGIIPSHHIYDTILKKEQEYRDTVTISEAKIPLMFDVEGVRQSTAAYMASHLNSKKLNVTVYGVNGILLSDHGKVDAVISNQVYDKTLKYEKRRELFFQLRDAITLINKDKINQWGPENIMHIRKSKYSSLG